MDRASQPARTGLTDRLAPDIARINFYRFCQLLEQSQQKAPLGSTDNPAADAVRFRPHPGMGFPVSELKNVERDVDNPDAPPTVRTTFLGLYGVDSPLPTAYLDYITQRHDGHDAVMAFLDIFNHRFITQYYRIWRKYNYPASFEAGAVDDISRCLLGLIGLGIPGSENHIATPVSRFLALLSVMRLPTRTAEGVTALVGLLAPLTKATVVPHDPQPVILPAPAGLSKNSRISLKTRTLLGAYRYRRQQPVAAETVYRRCRRSTWLAARRATAQRFAGAAARLSGLALSGPSATDAARQPVACCPAGKTACTD